MKTIAIALALTTSIMALALQSCAETINFDNLFLYRGGNGNLPPSVPDLAIEIRLTNSILVSASLTPFFNIYAANGQLLPDKLSLELAGANVGYDYAAVPNYLEIDPTQFDRPLVIDSAFFGNYNSRLWLGIGGTIGWPAEIITYNEQHQGEVYTMEYGFQLLSLDYTAVPEPGTVAMLMLGLVGLFGAHWLRK